MNAVPAFGVVVAGASEKCVATTEGGDIGTLVPPQPIKTDRQSTCRRENIDLFMTPRFELGGTVKSFRLGGNARFVGCGLVFDNPINF